MVKWKEMKFQGGAISLRTPSDSKATGKPVDKTPETELDMEGFDLPEKTPAPRRKPPEPVSEAGKDESVPKPDVDGIDFSEFGLSMENETAEAPPSTRKTPPPVKGGPPPTPETPPPTPETPPPTQKTPPVQEALPSAQEAVPTKPETPSREGDTPPVEESVPLARKRPPARVAYDVEMEENLEIPEPVFDETPEKEEESPQDTEKNQERKKDTKEGTGRGRKDRTRGRIEKKGREKEAGSESGAEESRETQDPPGPRAIYDRYKGSAAAYAPKDLPVEARHVLLRRIAVPVPLFALLVIAMIAVFILYLAGIRGGDRDARQGGADLSGLEVVDAELAGEVVENAGIGPVFVITGHVRNTESRPRSRIAVTGHLFLRGGFFREETVYCGNLLSKPELGRFTLEEIRAWLGNPKGTSRKNAGIAGGAKIPFMVVFDRLPGNADLLDRYTVTVQGAE